MTRSWALLFVVLLSAVFLGCSSGADSSGASSNQVAIESGSVKVSALESDKVRIGLLELTSRYGLTEQRDLQLESTVGSYERRTVIFSGYGKNGLLGLYVNNGANAQNLDYQIFAEPFSAVDLDRFRKDFHRLANTFSRREPGGRKTRTRWTAPHSTDR